MPKTKLADLDTEGVEQQPTEPTEKKATPKVPEIHAVMVEKSFLNGEGEKQVKKFTQYYTPAELADLRKHRGSLNLKILSVDGIAEKEEKK